MLSILLLVTTRFHTRKFLQSFINSVLWFTSCFSKTTVEDGTVCDHNSSICSWKLELKTRAPHAIPTLVCQGQSFYLKYLVKKGHNSRILQEYSFQSYATGLATTTCNDELVFQVWCWYLNTFWVKGYIRVFARRRQQQRRRSSNHNSSTFSSKQTS